jgi:hypothetical protein
MVGDAMCCTSMHACTRVTHPFEAIISFFNEMDLVCLHVSLRRSDLWTIVGRGHAPTCQ